MEPVTSSAIVLGGVDYGDSSRILWLLTPEFGRQSLMVRGVKKAKSKFHGITETFNCLRVIYRKTSGRDHSTIYTLHDADVVERFDGLRSDLDSFWAASQAASLVRAISHEDQESAELFETLSVFLRTLSSAAEGMNPRALLSSFRWRLTYLTGFEPQLIKCSACGRDLDRQAEYTYSVSGGGIVCVQCSSSGYLQYSTSVSYDELRFIYRSVARFPPSESLSSTGVDLTKIDSLVLRYFSYHLGDNRAFSQEALSWPGENFSNR